MKEYNLYLTALVLMVGAYLISKLEITYDSASVWSGVLAGISFTLWTVGVHRAWKRGWIKAKRGD